MTIGTIVQLMPRI